MLFRQARVGRDGEEFTILKFRTMRDPNADEPFALDGDLAPGGVEGIDRRTRVGTFLRKTSIDELPQLLNVLKGEPKTPEHRERHPFGKVPVLDHDGMRILETTAIARYLNDVLPGKSLIPSTPKDRARMDMVIALVDSYGYGALTGGVAAYHLFPDFVGGKNEAMRKDITLGGLIDGLRVVQSGLDANDMVIVAGLLKIFAPGTPVKASEVAMGAPSAPAAASAVKLASK